MSIYSEAIWVSASPSLRGFSTPLVHKLINYTKISGWEYIQSLDEPACMDTAVELLHSYLKTKEVPINLIGLGVGGRANASKFKRCGCSVAAFSTVRAIAL